MNPKLERSIPSNITIAPAPSFLKLLLFFSNQMPVNTTVARIKNIAIGSATTVNHLKVNIYNLMGPAN